MDKYVKTWSDDRISRIVDYLKDWNTNSRHSFLSQCLINTLIRVVKVDRLSKIKDVVLALPGLLAYTERHFQRLDRLHEATYLLEYMSSQMSILPIENSSTMDAQWIIIRMHFILFIKRHLVINDYLKLYKPYYNYIYIYILLVKLIVT